MIFVAILKEKTMWKPREKKCRLKEDIQQLFKCPEYLSWVHEVKKPKCMCCEREYYYISDANKMELHHVKQASSDKKDDRIVVPLCGIECHRLGTKLSAHGTPKLFREKFSIEYQKSYARKLFEVFKEEELL
jgi:hypothetical protein